MTISIDLLTVAKIGTFICSLLLLLITVKPITKFIPRFAAFIPRWFKLCWHHKKRVVAFLVANALVWCIEIWAVGGDLGYLLNNGLHGVGIFIVGILSVAGILISMLETSLGSTWPGD